MSILKEIFGLNEGPPGQKSGPTRDPDVPKAFGGDQKQLKKSAPFKPAGGPQIAQGGDAGGGSGRLTADSATLEALASALEAGAARGGEWGDWAEDCVQAINAALRKGDGTVTLPKFEATPDLDDFNDEDF